MQKKSHSLQQNNLVEINFPTTHLLNQIDQTSEEILLKVQGAKQRIKQAVKVSYEKMKLLLVNHLDDLYDKVNKIFDQNSKYSLLEEVVSNFKDLKCKHKIENTTQNKKNLLKGVHRLLFINTSKQFKNQLDEESVFGMTSSIENSITLVQKKMRSQIESSLNSRIASYNKIKPNFRESLDFIPRTMKLDEEYKRGSFYSLFRSMEIYQKIVVKNKMKTSTKIFSKGDPETTTDPREKVSKILQLLGPSSNYFKSFHQNKRHLKIFETQNIVLFSAWKSRTSQKMLVFSTFSVDTKGELLFQTEIESDIKTIKVSKNETFVLVQTDNNLLKCFKISPGFSVSYWFKLTEITDFSFCTIKNETCVAMLNSDYSLIVSRLKDQKLLFSSKTLKLRNINYLDELNLFYVSVDYKMGIFSLKTFSSVSEIDFMSPRPTDSKEKYHPQVCLYGGSDTYPINHIWKDKFFFVKSYSKLWKVYTNKKTKKMILSI